MKKWMIGILTTLVLLGGATYVAADSTDNGLFNFEEMKPYIEKMHPNLSDQEQKTMFNDCHGENGYMQDNNGAQNMMHNF